MDKRKFKQFEKLAKELKIDISRCEFIEEVTPQWILDKYLNNIIYCDHYEGGGWIVKVKSIQTVDGETIFIGPTIRLETPDTSPGGDGYIFCGSKSVSFDIDYEEKLHSINILNENELKNLLTTKFKYSIDEFCENF